MIQHKFLIIIDLLNFNLHLMVESNMSKGIWERPKEWA